MRWALVAVLGPILLTGCKRSATEAPASLAPDSAPAAEPDAAAAPAKRSPVLREETTVMVAGKVERWRLEWLEPPTPECMDDVAFTCPCAGIEFGEEGALDLVRERDGEPEDRLHLDALYNGHVARLPRWRRLPSDSLEKVPSVAEIQRRPLVRLLAVADYDHDGQASEVVFRVGYEACGHTPTLVVGVSRNHPKLHAFATAETPEEPLTLERPEQWETVRAALPATLQRFGCGDHGSETTVTTTITRDAVGLHAKDVEKKCP